jgi:hypothetical protein
VCVRERERACACVSTCVYMRPWWECVSAKNQKRVSNICDAVTLAPHDESLEPNLRLEVALQRVVVLAAPVANSVCVEVVSDLVVRAETTSGDGREFTCGWAKGVVWEIWSVSSSSALKETAKWYRLCCG